MTKLGSRKLHLPKSDVDEVYNWSQNRPNWVGALRDQRHIRSIKNEKSEDYSKADLKQRVLFFHNNISAGHTSHLPGTAQREGLGGL